MNAEQTMISHVGPLIGGPATARGSWQRIFKLTVWETSLFFNYFLFPFLCNRCPLCAVSSPTAFKKTMIHAKLSALVLNAHYILQKNLKRLLCFFRVGSG